MQKRKYTVGGIGVVNATPLTDDGELNEQEYRRHLRFMADAGITFIQPAAATGQGMETSEREFMRILEISLEEVGDRVFVTAYTGRDSTEETIRLTKMARDVGVHAAYIIQPFFSLPDAEGIYRHFAAIGEAVPGLPLCFYNNPARAGVRLPIDVMVRLVDEFDSFVGLKQSELDQMADSCLSLGNRIPVMAKSEKELLAGLVHGAPGALTFAGNLIPAELVSILKAFEAGDLAAARTTFYRVLPLINAIHFEPVPSVIKYALDRMGWQFGPLRLPGHTISASTKERVDEILDGILAASAVRTA